MKILFLPIYDPSHHAVSVANKHGIRDALIAAGHEVVEFDYCEPPVKHLWNWLYFTLERFNPDLLFTQLQGFDRINEPFARKMRSDFQNPIWVNFNQDPWPKHYIEPDMLAMLKHVDLQLVSNGSVLPTYEQAGIKAAYWPFGYETPNRPLPDVPSYDVVFLGNAYSEFKQRLGALIQSLPYNIGLYGSGWNGAQGDCNYDFTYGEALYKNAKIAISDNEFPDYVGYMSNRPFQILAAGGALCLQQRVKDMEKLTGLRAGYEVAEFDTLDNLPAVVDYWMRDPDNLRAQIAGQGQAFVKANHSFDVRIAELMAMVEGLRV